MKAIFYYIFLCLFFFQLPVTSLHAKELKDEMLRAQRRLSLAQSFVSKLKQGLQKADDYLLSVDPDLSDSVLPDGEILLFQPVLAHDLRVDGFITGRVHNNKILLSLNDIRDVLQIPINIDETGKRATGWYVYEEKAFFLDVENRVARTDIGEFQVSENILAEDADIFVPVGEFGRWIDFEFKPDISAQELDIVSSELLPIQKRYLRRQSDITKIKRLKPSLPLKDDERKSVGYPAIDVATRSTYRRPDPDRPGTRTHSATVRTVGDFLDGTLTTQSQLNNRDQLTNVRLNYKQESPKSDLLGPLKARRFDAGDVTTTRVGIGGNVSQELGVRLTNADPLRRTQRATTAISGTAFPGWEVELYRSNHFIGFREIGDDGFYSFDNVELFLSNNNFKLLFYGPQGEVREETLFCAC